MKNRIFNLGIRDDSYTPARIWLVLFLYDDSKIKNPEKEIRAAVQDFLKTKEGKEAVEYACGNFNWEDAMCSVPDEFFKSRGLIPLKSETCNAKVEHDEILSN